MVENYHSVLGVSPDASRDEILQAYSALVKNYHPDHNHARNAEREFRRIQHAFEMLYEPERHQRNSGVFHDTESAFLRVRTVHHLRKGRSAQDMSQSFAPVLVLLTVFYVLVAAIPFSLMLGLGVESGDLEGVGIYRILGGVLFVVVTLLFITGMAKVMVMITGQR